MENQWRERSSIRYCSELLPESLSKVTISCGADSSFEADVVNCCTHGISVSIPPLEIMSDFPKKNNVVKVRIPVDDTWITGMCVHVAKEPEGTVSMGIYFYYPTEQNYLHNLLGIATDVQPQSDSFVCHEWEELVDKLCNLEDPKLQALGDHELDILKARGEGDFISKRPLMRAKECA
jgi:hypothetical protein